MKTIQDMAIEFANRIEKQEADCPRGCANPGLYFGFLAGVAAIKDELEVMGYDYNDLMVGGEFIPRDPATRIEYGYDPDTPYLFYPYECPVITSREKK